MSGFQIWWKDREVKAKLSVYNKVSGEYVEKDVIYIVDCPDGRDALRLKQCYLAVNMLSSQIEAGYKAMSTRLIGRLQNIQAEVNAISLRAEKARNAATISPDDPDAAMKAVEEEKASLEALGNIDILDTTIASDHNRMTEFMESNAQVIRDATHLICKYVKGVILDVGPDGVGSPVLFEGKPWSELDEDGKIEIALRLSNQFLQPLIEALSRGAETEVLGK